LWLARDALLPEVTKLRWKHRGDVDLVLGRQRAQGLQDG